MRRKKKVVDVSPVAMAPVFAEVPAAPLKRQSSYSRKPWQPGEIPGGPLMKVSRPHDEKPAPYGHGTLGVECPMVGRGRDPLVDTTKEPYEDAKTITGNSLP